MKGVNALVYYLSDPITNKDLAEMNELFEQAEKIEATVFCSFNVKSNPNFLKHNTNLYFESKGNIAIAIDMLIHKGFKRIAIINPTISVDILEVQQGILSLKLLDYSIGITQKGYCYFFALRSENPLIIETLNWANKEFTSNVIKEIGRHKLSLYKLKTIDS